MPAIGALLHHGKQRDAVETGECTEHRHVQKNAPGAGTREEFGDRVDGNGMHRWLGEKQFNGEQTHANGAEGHQPQFNPPIRHSLAKQRADAHADRECS